MKLKNSITLILLILSLSVEIDCTAQSFITEDKIWSQLIYKSPSITIMTEHLKILGDTTINDTIYKKIFRSTDKEMSEWGKYMLIRENEGKIFLRTDTSAQEYLFFDINVEPDDTLILTSHHSLDGKNRTFNKSNFTVTGIDTVTILGYSRKRIQICPENQPETEYFIEGIGSASGLLYLDDGLVGGDNYDLLCCQENETLIFHNDKYTGCYYTYPSNSTDEISNYKYIRVLSSLNKTITIQNLTGESGIIEFFTIKGEPIFQQELSQDETILYFPENGVYLYRFTGKAGKAQSGKFIIN